MKTISVPKNNEALDRLDYNKTEEGDLFEVFLGDDVFDELSKLGFFQVINKIAHSNIDNFEDEVITEEIYLNNILNSDIFSEKKYDAEIFKVVKKIEELFFRALKYKTGIFFYF